MSDIESNGFDLVLNESNAIYISIRHYVHVNKIAGSNAFQNLEADFNHDKTNQIYGNNEEAISKFEGSLKKLIELHENFIDVCNKELTSKFLKGRPTRMLTNAEHHIEVPKLEILRQIQKCGIAIRDDLKVDTTKTECLVASDLADINFAMLKIPNAEEFSDVSQKTRQLKLETITVPPTFNKLEQIVKGPISTFREFIPDVEAQVDNWIDASLTEERRHDLSINKNEMSSYMNNILDRAQGFTMGQVHDQITKDIKYAIDPEHGKYNEFLEICKRDIPEKVASYNGRSGIMKLVEKHAIEQFEKVFELDFVG